MWPVIDLWILCRRYAGPFNPPPLPAPGSPGQQPAALMDAFVILDRMEAKANGG